MKKTYTTFKFEGNIYLKFKSVIVTTRRDTDKTYLHFKNMRFSKAKKETFEDLDIEDIKLLLFQLEKIKHVIFGADKIFKTKYKKAYFYKIIIINFSFQSSNEEELLELIDLFSNDYKEIEHNHFEELYYKEDRKEKVIELVSNDKFDNNFYYELPLEIKSNEEVALAFLKKNGYYSWVLENIIDYLSDKSLIDILENYFLNAKVFATRKDLLKRILLKNSIILKRGES